MHCFAGCDDTDVLAALGLTVRDLYNEPRGDVYTTYVYPGGRIVDRGLDSRTGRRGFWQSGNKADRSLFREDRLGDAPVVFVVEGEEDVFAVESVGGVAVTSSGGSRSAHKADWSPLKGRTVIVVADRDKAGDGYAATVVRLLDGVAATVTVMRAAVGKDAADHIAAGLSLDELVPLADDGEPTPGPTSGAADDRPRLRRATDLKPSKRLTWLAKDRLPRAAVSLLIGDEGIGKSLLWVWVAAAITTGKPLPEFGIPEREPGHIAIVVTEDDWQTTVRPRLEVAGVDLAMVSVFCTEDDGSGTPVFPRDIHLLHEADPSPVLVVLDAWVDTVSAGLTVKDPQQARQALHPFREVAIATEAAIWLLCHTNRVDTANMRDKYGLTSELRKKVRMALYAQADEDGAMVVGPDKTNLSAAVKASRFAIEKVRVFEPTEDSDGTVPRLVYAGESDRTAREHLVDAYGAERSDAAATGDATGWLAAFLGPGPQWSVDVHDAREREGISKRQLRSAKRKLNIGSDRDGPKGPWYMFLPQHEGQMPATPPPAPDAPYPWGWASDDLGRSERTSGGPSPDARPDARSKTSDASSTSQDVQKTAWRDKELLGASGRRGDTAPPCVYCGAVVAAGQRDAAGRPAHLGCQQTVRRKEITE